MHLLIQSALRGSSKVKQARPSPRPTPPHPTPTRPTRVAFAGNHQRAGLHLWVSLKEGLQGGVEVCCQRQFVRGNGAPLAWQHRNESEVGECVSLHVVSPRACGGDTCSCMSGACQQPAASPLPTL